MKNVDGKLEILIGRFLDGEISPAEQKVLERELEHNAEAGELLEQMQLLNQCSREAVAAEVTAQGMGPDEVLERCRQRQVRASWPGLVRTGGRFRFVIGVAAGVAAGFIVGLLLHFVLTGLRSEAPSPREQYPNRWVIDDPEMSSDIVRVLSPNGGRPMMRNVDWYSVTDDAGNQWLIQGVREGVVIPTAYEEAPH